MSTVPKSLPTARTIRVQRQSSTFWNTTDRRLRTARCLFSPAPHVPLGRTAVGDVITWLGSRTGSNVLVGGHRLRHIAATAVLAAGGTMAEAA